MDNWTTDVPAVEGAYWVTLNADLSKYALMYFNPDGIPRAVSINVIDFSTQTFSPPAFALWVGRHHPMFCGPLLSPQE